MIKLISIFFSIMILLQSTNIHIDDIVNVNKFIKHVQLHQENYGDDFFTFLSKHYGDLKESHSEQHQEEQKNSPDENNHKCLKSLNLFTHHFCSLELLNNHKNVNSHSYYQDKFSTFEKQPCFRPPQLT